MQIMRDGPVGSDSPLKHNVALIIEQQFPDTGNNGPRLRAAGSRYDLTERKTILEFVDGSSAEHRTDAGKLQIRIIIHLLGHLFHRNIELRRDAVQKRPGPRGADPAHFRGPHSHGLVVNHRLAVLPPDIQNRFHLRMKMTRSRHMGGNFADLKIIMDKTTRILNNLTAGHHCTAYRFLSNSRLRQKCLHNLFHGSHVARAAARTAPAAGQSPGINRLRPLVCTVEDLPVLRQQNRFERG